MPSSGATLTPLSLAALALLAERPMHPYEMYQLSLQRRDHRLVKIRPGTLYHAVSRLAADGYVRAVGTEREGNRPERTTYEITEAGRAVLQREVAAMLAEVADEYPSFPFALSDAHNLPVAEVTRLLRQRLSVVRETMEDLDAGVDQVTAKKLPWAYWLHLDYLRSTYRAEADWLQGALTDIAAGRFDLPNDHQKDSSP
jgi:DNA-binding PadR family transcriptional regulator